jgi:hypothetical protein
LTEYLSYWKPGTALNELDAGGELCRSASNQYGKIEIGDSVFIVTVWPTGDLILLGRIKVSELLERSAARARYDSENLWDANWYILAEKGTTMPVSEIDISGVAIRLRFRSNLDRLSVSPDGAVKPQQLQTIRALTSDSSAILEERIAQFQSATSSIDKNLQGDGQGLGSPEMNKIVEMNAIEIATRYYQSLGWRVVSREADKCGFDLECSRESDLLRIEVKGTSSGAPGFIITYNEYTFLQESPDWRLALVTRALSSHPKLFVFDAEQIESMFLTTPIAFRMSPRIEISSCQIF